MEVWLNFAPSVTSIYMSIKNHIGSGTITSESVVCTTDRESTVCWLSLPDVPSFCWTTIFHRWLEGPQNYSPMHLYSKRGEDCAYPGQSLCSVEADIGLKTEWPSFMFPLNQEDNWTDWDKVLSSVNPTSHKTWAPNRSNSTSDAKFFEGRVRSKLCINS